MAIFPLLMAFSTRRHRPARSSARCATGATGPESSYRIGAERSDRGLPPRESFAHLQARGFLPGPADRRRPSGVASARRNQSQLAQLLLDAARRVGMGAGVGVSLPRDDPLL